MSSKVLECIIVKHLMAHLEKRGPSCQVVVKLDFTVSRGTHTSGVINAWVTSVIYGIISAKVSMRERENIALHGLCTIMAISRQNEALLFLNNYNTSTIDSAAHFKPLNSLEH